MINISICIPTYNRADFVRELLVSIVKQGDLADVEIAISDNASTDDTSGVVDEFRSVFPNLVYHRNEVNLGADRNYLSAVSLASGLYCWLMGSDDVLEPGSIAKIKKIIQGGADVYLIDRYKCDFKMNKIERQAWFAPDAYGKLWNLGDKNELLALLRKTGSLGGVFSYLSSIVVNRELWRSQVPPISFIGTAYVHAAHLFGINALQGLRMSCVSDPVIYTRGENDSFVTRSRARRVLIDFIGYRSISQIYIQDGQCRDEMLAVLDREWRVIRTLGCACNLKLNSTKEDWRELVMICSSSLPFNLALVVVNWIPVGLLYVISLIRRKMARG